MQGPAHARKIAPWRRAAHWAIGPETARGLSATVSAPVRGVFRAAAPTMFPRFRITFLAMSLLSLLGCSPRSTELPPLGELCVEATIEDLTERGHDTPDYSRQDIKVVLRRRGGSAIERGDVRLEVNGETLEFRVGTGNYYDRYPYYRLPENSRVRVLPAADYRFTLVLPDGARHEVGTVRTPAPLTVAQFDFPKLRPASGDVAIGWRDLAEPAALAVFRSDTYVDADNVRVLEAGSAHDPAALRKEIGPGLLRRRSDRWVLPEKFLANGERRTLRTLGAELVVAQAGRVAKTFAKDSTLRAERRLVLRMECGGDE